MTATAENSTPLLPGAAIIVGIRSLLVWGVVASGVLGTFLRGTHQSCTGGISSNGQGFLTADGAPTDIEPSCGMATLSPSPLVFLLLAAIVIGSLTLILRRAVDEDHAFRILGNARMSIVIVTLVALAVGWIAVMTLQIDDWGSYSIFSPQPFAQFDVESWLITQR
ncbi:hypothetical protein [uncultured Microbacterium sp.]|uniref:hypothetical protein n=1 Tax=uncultured Microbacterium sp. TaxID=191216 RepID=UPI0028D813B5|nr:hypothetical protein [uncultured Microbacterium sp.]